MFVCARLLALVSEDVVCEPARSILGTDGFNVQIAPECSGYEGIGLVIAAFALFLCLFRRVLRFPQALLLLPVGVAAIWLCNALRIVALILLGAHVSPKMAVDGFHSQAGWIAFTVISLAMCAIALRLPWFAQRRVQKQAELCAETSGPCRADTAAYLMPLLTMIAAAMITAAFSAGFDWLYPLKIAAGLAALWWYRATYRGFVWSWSWFAILNGVVVFALWIVMERLSTHSGTALAKGLDSLPRFWAITWLAARVLGSVLVVPAARSLLFAATCCGGSSSRDFESVTYRSTPWWAVAISSLLFGLLHGHRLGGGHARRRRLCAGRPPARAVERRDRRTRGHQRVDCRLRAVDPLLVYLGVVPQWNGIWKGVFGTVVSTRKRRLRHEQLIPTIGVTAAVELTFAGTLAADFGARTRWRRPD